MTPSDLVARIVQRPFTWEQYPFPRIDPETEQPICYIGLRVLDQMSIAAARMAALRAVQKDLGSEIAKFNGAEQVLEDRVVLETLRMALVDPTDPDNLKPLFESAQQLGEALVPSEVIRLWNAFNEIQVRYLAHEGVVLSQAQYTAALGLLKEGLRSYPFLPKSFEGVADLLLCSAERLWSLYALQACPRETWLTHLDSMFAKWDSDTLCYTGLRVNGKKTEEKNS